MSKMGIDRAKSRIATGKPFLMRQLVRNSKLFFERNFAAQGFRDIPSKRWKALKKPRPGGKILVKTSRLQNSAKTRIFNSSRGAVMFTAPYASFHNKGDRRLPQRQFSGESRILNRMNEKIILNYIKSKLR